MSGAGVPVSLVLAPRRQAHYHNSRYENWQFLRARPMSRPRGDHDERREVIALAAADVIASRGLDRLTMRDLAAELGVTTGVLTHYFPSKDALVSFTKEWIFDLRYERARMAADGASGAERVQAVVADMLPVDAERRRGWRMLIAFHGSAVGSAAMRRAHERRMRRWFALFDELVGDGMADADATGTGMAVALLVEGMSIHLAMMEPPMPADQQRAFAREQVERLLRPAASPAGERQRASVGRRRATTRRTATRRAITP